jgi:hypothetical protein
LIDADLIGAERTAALEDQTYTITPFGAKTLPRWNRLLMCQVIHKHRLPTEIAAAKCNLLKWL